MSLEDKIGELTAAVNALTAALAHPVPIVKPLVSIVKPSVPDVTHNPVQAKAEVAPPKPAATVTPPTIATTATPGTTSTPATTGGIDYAQVAKAITDTFKVDRAKTIETLAMFGAQKGPQLKPEDYAAFLKELTS
jgi:hypothetical protein